ncbi:MAG: metallophosphatase family protein [Desulfobulbaceae bacterium]|nr:metallophosphatase family protein [Desulfobulbaceae bacterium]
MRLAVISDIHGNYQALKAVLADIVKVGADEILSLGDNIGYGPEPEEVILALKENDISSVLGNHELALSSESYFQRLNWPPQVSLDISRQLMSPESIEFCKSLPSFLIRDNARFVHGSPPESVTTYLWDPAFTRLERIFLSFPEKMCFFGHTHDMARYIAKDKKFHKESVAIGRVKLEEGCRYIMNPGSVGQPRDDISNQAKYIIWDLKKNEIDNRAVAYDIAQTIELLKQRNFPESNAIRLRW